VRLYDGIAAFDDHRVLQAAPIDKAVYGDGGISYASFQQKNYLIVYWSRVYFAAGARIRLCALCSTMLWDPAVIHRPVLQRLPT
jgi:hypothetical protein